MIGILLSLALLTYLACRPVGVPIRAPVPARLAAGLAVDLPAARAVPAVAFPG